MDTDPYITPAANPQIAPISAAAGTVSAAAVQQLAATKPWVRFISVLTFIVTGFMLLAAAGMIVMGAVGGMAGSHGSNQFTGAMGFGLGAVYVVMAIVYVFPGIKLWKYASSIAMLIQTGRNEDLVAALNQQRSFWKFVGVFLIAIMVIYLIAIIAAVAVAGVTAFKTH